MFLLWFQMLLHLSISIVDINKGTTKGNGWDSILFLISLMPYTYSLLAIVLFVNLGRIIRISFRSMVMELKEKKALPYLSIWEHEKQFSIITRAANDLQNSFALILFLTVFYALTGFIMASYNLFRFFQELPGLPDHICVYCKMGKLIFFVIEHLIRLWLICHTPDEIHYEVLCSWFDLSEIELFLDCFSLAGLFFGFSAARYSQPTLLSTMAGQRRKWRGQNIASSCINQMRNRS